MTLWVSPLWGLSEEKLLHTGLGGCGPALWSSAESSVSSDAAAAGEAGLSPATVLAFGHRSPEALHALRAGRLRM